MHFFLNLFILTRIVQKFSKTKIAAFIAFLGSSEPMIICVCLSACFASELPAEPQSRAITQKVPAVLARRQYPREAIRHANQARPVSAGDNKTALIYVLIDRSGARDEKDERS